MSVARQWLVVPAVSIAVLLGVPMAWAGDGDRAKSDAVGADATCTMHSRGRGFRVTCVLRDTKRDGNSVRIEWSGPGKDGKDNLKSGAGTRARFQYTFARETGVFRFKAVTDRGVLPDSVGRQRELLP
jgi:hypothetical protein